MLFLSLVTTGNLRKAQSHSRCLTLWNTAAADRILSVYRIRSKYSNTSEEEAEKHYPSMYAFVFPNIYFFYIFKQYDTSCIKNQIATIVK